jgi:hypothetical protein
MKDGSNSASGDGLNLDPQLWDADNRGQPMLRGLTHAETCELAALVRFAEDFHRKLDEMREPARQAFQRRDELLACVCRAVVN